MKKVWNSFETLCNLQDLKFYAHEFSWELSSNLWCYDWLKANFILDLSHMGQIWLSTHMGILGKKFLGHQFKNGHFQCKTQIKPNNWVGTPHKGPNSHPPIYRRGQCAQWPKYWFLNSVSNHIIWPLIWWKLMLHRFEKC